jgi:DNA-directed RNA polymerase specialized sigma24 family protein
MPTPTTSGRIVMLRTVREMPTLRESSRLRAWLVAITVRQVGTHLHRRRVAGARLAPLEHAVDVPLEDVTKLHAVLYEPRRQVAWAGPWLDSADRMLLSLWWLDQAGQLTRRELAEAAGVRAAHVPVRLQRMRDRLELSRSVVAALATVPHRTWTPPPPAGTGCRARCGARRPARPVRLCQSR